MRLFFLLLGVSSLAIADDAAILRCRTITESVARLACYDALVITPAVNNSRTDAATGKVFAPAVAASTSTLQAQKSSQFGLEEKAAKKDELDAIDSHIVGSFEGWRAGSNIRLANGQVWQVTDDSSRAHYIDNPKVRIRRGALGAFYLEIQGTNHSPRVKRVQ